MRYSEITTEDITRRGFLQGAGAAAGLGTLGYGALQQQKTMPSSGSTVKDAPGAATTDKKPETVATTPQPTKSAPDPTPPVVQKYSPQELKDYIIKYARKHLPEKQVIPFISQVAHESHDFRSLEENLNYSASVLLKKYPKLFNKKTAEYVAEHPRKDQIIANNIYANRMGNGDSKSGDGYKYRGRGYIQLTGRENYERMSKLLNVDLINNPDLAAQPSYAAAIAVTYWNTRVANRVNTSNIAQVTRRIAGSAKQGIKSRTEKLKQFTKELGKK